MKSLRKLAIALFCGFLLTVGLIRTAGADIIPLPGPSLEYQGVGIQRQITLINIRKSKTAEIKTWIVPGIGGSEDGEIVLAIPTYGAISNVMVSERPGDDFTTDIARLDSFIEERASWPNRFRGRILNGAFTFGIGRVDTEVPVAASPRNDLMAWTQSLIANQPGMNRSLGVEILETKEKDSLKALLQTAQIPEDIRFRLRLYADCNIMTVRVRMTGKTEADEERGLFIRYDTELASTDRGFRLQLPFSTQRLLPGVVQLNGIYVETPRRTSLNLDLPQGFEAQERVASPNQAVVRIVYKDQNAASDLEVLAKDTEQDVWWDLGETVSHWLFERTGYFFAALYGMSVILALRWARPGSAEERSSSGARIMAYVKRLAIASMVAYILLAGISGLMLWQIV